MLLLMRLSLYWLTCAVCIHAAKAASKPSQLFHSVEFFLSHLSLRGMDSVVRHDSTDVFTPREEERYGVVRCNVSMTVLDLATVLLEKHTSQAFTVSRSFKVSNEMGEGSLWDLIVKIGGAHQTLSLKQYLMCLSCAVG